ncbi:MAG TPA: tripartite tricarboxylate transporter TctB family protein [Burkholderiales bacterium]|jgi:putative tricarboxylic transport membrane protein|nr:tripartite tricarboxylate transporter TctB family protein [Burkholderiales bacterium]
MVIKSPKDFWAGVMFVAFGAGMAAIAVNSYQMGSAVRMGPAYFPSVLGGLLAVLGLILLVRSCALKGEQVAKFHFRPLVLILAACVAFGYFLKPLGLLGAIALLIFIGAFGGHEFKWKEVATLYVVLFIFSVLVFVKGLTLPFPICPAVIEDFCRF